MARWVYERASLAALTVVMTLGIALADGPFGLEVSMKMKQLEEINGKALDAIVLQEHLYSMKVVPKPHIAFELYAVQVLPEAGLCQVRAIGKDLQTSSHGLQLKAAWQELLTALEGIYGQSKKTDLLLPGSIWKEPEDWMMGLLKHERFLSALWESSPTRPLKNHIQQIGLEARAKDRDSGFLFLQYNFNNREVCEAELKAAEKEAL